MKKGIKIGIPSNMTPDEASDILLKALKIKEETPKSPIFEDPDIEKISKRAEKIYDDINNEMLKEIFEVLGK